MYHAQQLFELVVGGLEPQHLPNIQSILSVFQTRARCMEQFRCAVGWRTAYARTFSPWRNSEYEIVPDLSSSKVRKIGRMLFERWLSLSEIASRSCHAQV